MKFISLSVFIACLIVSTYSATCPNPNTIISSTFLDSIFDTTFSAIRSPTALNNVISDPSTVNLQLYFLSFAPAVVPLWVMAGVTFFVFIGCCIQILCYQVCGSQKCGNQIGPSTYNPTAVKCGAFWYFFMAVLGMALCIAAMVVSSDLAQQSNYSSCNTQQVTTQMYQGSQNPLMPWSGINNFNALINNISIFYQDAYPTLTNYFSSSNSAFGPITSNAAGSLYTLASTFSCTVQTNTIACPFPASASANCPPSATPTFSNSYCDPAVNTSAQARITNEINTNSSVWRNSILNISTLLTTLGSSTTDLSSLATSVSTFVGVIGPYESQIQSELSKSNMAIYNFQIAAYTFYAFIILSSLIGFVAICCSFCLRKFCCKFFLNVLWIVFMVLGVFLFVLSGFLLAASFATYDSCSAYTYFFANQTNFNTLNFSNQTIGQIFNKCYFAKSISILSAFNQSSAPVQNLITLNNTYFNALPSTNFTTAGTSITNGLYNIMANPNIVTFTTGTSANSPQAALDAANLFANFSAAGSSQPGPGNTCATTQDFLTFNPASCNSWSINTLPPINSCVVINSQTSITARVNSFSAITCTNNQATIYSDNFNALLAYTNSIAVLVNSYLSAGNLNSYMTNYYNYYAGVMNFMNPQIQAIFRSFLSPYNQMNSGTSCAFLTTSLNSLTDTACNAVFPYLNALAILTSCISAVAFILMILSYFMKVRVDYYEFLDGDFDNYAKPMRSKQMTDGIQMDTRNNQFLNTSDRRN